VSNTKTRYGCCKSEFACVSIQVIYSVITNDGSLLHSFNHPIGLATACQGVAHTFEIPFVYPTILHFLSNYTLTPEEETLSQEVITYWTDFAIMYTNGTSGSLSNWPQYTLQNDENIILDLTLSTQKGYRKVYCDFWDKINTY
jgi:carboxylesterase type B